MATYRITELGTGNLAPVAAVQYFDRAKAEADRLHKETGLHYLVTKVQDVYTTQTVDEALASA